MLTSSDRTDCASHLLLLLVVTVGCAKEIDDHGSSNVDFTRPKSVVASIFYAARTGDAKHLATLCDPDGKGNEFVRRICDEDPRRDDWASFERNFAKGRLNGEPRITGDEAAVNFIYGPEGKDVETMQLVRRRGRWYLQSF